MRVLIQLCCVTMLLITCAVQTRLLAVRKWILQTAGRCLPLIQGGCFFAVLAYSCSHCDRSVLTRRVQELVSEWTSHAFSVLCPSRTSPHVICTYRHTVWHVYFYCSIIDDMQCEMTSRLLIMCTLLALSASTVAVNMSVVPTLSSTMSSMDETVSTSQLSSDDGSGMNSTDGMMMPSSEAISSVVTSSEAIPSTTVSSTTQDIATTASSSAFPTATSSSSSSTARPTAELPSDMSDAVSLGVAVGVGGTVLLCLSAATLILCIYYIK